MRREIIGALEDMAVEMESQQPDNSYRVRERGNTLELVERRGISPFPDWLRPAYGIVKIVYNGGIDVTTNNDPFVDRMVIRYVQELGYRAKTE